MSMAGERDKPIKFSVPDLRGRVTAYVNESLNSGLLAGDGPFTERCHQKLELHFNAPVLLTHSGTAALEMAALLIDIAPGDEVIMPSYTFVSTANAFVLRGGVPVFVDIRPDTLNLDETLLDMALSPRTRAIVPVHYAGVGCAMDVILPFAESHGVKVIEDAAQGYLATWKGRPLGGLGALGALSFHASKNIVSGEGGLLVINDRTLEERARVIREKGTNRTAFSRGIVAKYEWLDLGSSFLPSDLLAAVLLAQIEEAEAITADRRALWRRYHAHFEELEREGRLRRPVVPHDAGGNAHIYYLLLDSGARQRQIQKLLHDGGIVSHAHYVPLHSSPGGRHYGRSVGTLPVTDRVADTMLRLPLHGRMTAQDVDRIADIITKSHAAVTISGA